MCFGESPQGGAPNATATRASLSATHPATQILNSLQGFLRPDNSQLDYLAVPRLLLALATALDTAAGSSLCTQHSALLARVPAASVREQPPAAADLQAPWGRRFKRARTWHAVHAQLLPALTALCTQLLQGSEQRNALFREVAPSAVGATWKQGRKAGRSQQAADGWGRYSVVR